MLDCLIRDRSFSCGFSSIQPAMSEVASELPFEGSCLFDMDACYETFDKDGDGQLNLDEFRLICKALFRNDKGHIYPLSEERARHIFQVFDKNDDGFIDKEEFTFCWNHWIKVIVRPVSAFLIVDVQNDFITGTLNISKCNAQQDGSEDLKRPHIQILSNSCAYEGRADRPEERPLKHPTTTTDDRTELRFGPVERRPQIRNHSLDPLVDRFSYATEPLVLGPHFLVTL